MFTQEQLKSVRKVRVIYNDPYATDSSSEDERQVVINPNPRDFIRIKRVTREIILERPDNQDKRLPSSRYIGVRKRKSRYGAEMRDPFTRKRLWLGTYDTEEEAATAYDRKNKEFQEMEANTKSAETNSSISQNSEEEFLVDDIFLHSPHEDFTRIKRGVREVILERPDRNLIQNQDKRLPSSRYIGVRKRNSRYGAEIRDPFTRKRFWLGTYDTKEEAAAAYDGKNKEFQEMEANTKSAETNSSISQNSDEEFLVDDIIPHSTHDECQLDQEMNIWFDNDFSKQSILELMGDSAKSEFKNYSVDNSENFFESLPADMEVIFSEENSFPQFDFEVAEEEFSWIDEVWDIISQ